jgi:putrescine transport system permease protein
MPAGRKSTKQPIARRRSRGERLAIIVPFLWLVAFFLVPFAIAFKISLSQTAIAQPPRRARPSD